MTMLMALASQSIRIAIAGSPAPRKIALLRNSNVTVALPATDPICPSGRADHESTSSGRFFVVSIAAAWQILRPRPYVPASSGRNPRGTRFAVSTACRVTMLGLLNRGEGRDVTHGSFHGQAHVRRPGRDVQIGRA